MKVMHGRQDFRGSAEGVTIRAYRAKDAPAVEVLRQRDTRPLPAGALILAEVEGSIVAARSLATGEVIADPFLPTASLVAMLKVRAEQLRPRHGRGGSLALRRRRQYARLEAA